MNLDKRLLCCANLIRPNCRVVDVGTDHAYLLIWLAQNKMIKYGIASDLRKGPLANAIDNIKKYKVDNILEARLSDGLLNIKENEVDDIVIAGMGGELISQIIKGAEWLKNKDKHLILQPMTCAKELREFLYKEGYDILKENTVLSSSRVYSVMLARFSHTSREVHELYPYIGKILDNYDYSTGIYIKREIRDLKNKCKGFSAVKNTEAENELNEVIKKLELLYKEYDHDNCTEHL